MSHLNGLAGLSPKLASSEEPFPYIETVGYRLFAIGFIGIGFPIEFTIY
jgi:hypothetical protein